jgi:hypothetical protein
MGETHMGGGEQSRADRQFSAKIGRKNAIAQKSRAKSEKSLRPL